jgi:coproporphyrinogen III oxidase
VFVESVINCYCTIVKQHLLADKQPGEQQKQMQLNYHTLYFYQVLTLDRGTTAGLLAHSQNDIGTLGSLPAHINRPLLESWLEKTPPPQDKLIKRLLDVLGEDEVCEITAEVKKNIAKQVRLHYLQYPLS